MENIALFLKQYEHFNGSYVVLDISDIERITSFDLPVIVSCTKEKIKTEQFLERIKALKNEYEFFVFSHDNHKSARLSYEDMEEILETQCDFSMLFIPLEYRQYRNFYDLQNIVSKLRGENGCPWDKKQTLLSMKKCLIEESEEVNDAIDNNDTENLIEELGDVLLVISMMTRIASEDKNFDMKDVTEEVCKKLIRRHPHVFGDLKLDSPEEALAMWKKIKFEEKREK